ncbi:Kinetochore subunit NKP2 [Niveomyces insectorum RCEF 264]|uniref:Kinetochore subunit NKP2 n=1 Tax=Niveomyces insectorum RCEF 264 TaxID=1081102 RepID=A0A167TU01_9HYPO|nr:Kinetochore subunit NKP2 [Niveomyces insectorum RCEF 264]
MAPSEAAILEQFLLVPAQLPAVVSLADFAALFPKALQTSPHVRTLYRDLQRQRNAVVDAVTADIVDEIARGRLLRRHAVRARLHADALEDAAGDDELLLERMVEVAHGGGRRGNVRGDGQGGRYHDAADTTETTSHRGHTLPSLVAELDAAAQDLAADVARLEDEERRLRQAVEQTVGGLSDLRYGRPANPQLRDQVCEGLQTVQGACEAVLGTNAGDGAQTTFT